MSGVPRPLHAPLRPLALPPHPGQCQGGPEVGPGVPLACVYKHVRVGYVVLRAGTAITPPPPRATSAVL